MCGFPFPFNSLLLFAPFSHLGFDFRSISHINDAAAVQGLLRDLNHHVPAFRTMARITLADWTCMFNGCKNPLGGTTARSFSRLKRQLPSAWVTALDVLHHLRLDISSTDQSHLFTGDVALRHIVRAMPPPPLTPDSLVISNLERAGLTHLSHVACWTSPDPTDFSQPFRLRPHHFLPQKLAGYSAGRDWPAFAHWLERLTLADLVRSSAGNDISRPAAASVPSDARWQLALPRRMRQQAAELLITAAASLSTAPTLPLERFADIVASDASAVERDAAHRGGERYKHVTFAAASPTFSLLLSISPSDRLASSLHGEVLGLISAILLHDARPRADVPARRMDAVCHP